MDAQALHREPQQLASETSDPVERLWSDLGNFWRVPALGPGESRLPVRRSTVQALRDARFVEEIAHGQVQPLSSAKPSYTARPQMLWSEIGGERPAHGPKTSLIHAVEQKHGSDCDKIQGESKAYIDDEEHEKRAEKNGFSSQFVREVRQGIGYQCGNEIKSCIDQGGHQDRRACLLCA